MADTVLVLGEGGTALVHDLPLPEGLAQRVVKGEAKVLGPCDPDGNLSADTGSEGPVEPPRAGKGASKDAWAAYAATVGVEVTDDMSRDDMIAAVDEARTADSSSEE